MKTIAVAAFSLLSGASLEAGYHYCQPRPVSAAPAPLVGEATPLPPATPDPVPVPSPAATSFPASIPPLASTISMPTPACPLEEENLWLTDYVSVRTPHGIVGFPPGQRVYVVGVDEETGKLRVSDGTYEVETSEVQLTNNPELAQRISSHDEAVQAAEYAAQRRAQMRNDNVRLQLAMGYADRVQASSIAALRPPAPAPVDLGWGSSYGGSSTLAGCAPPARAPHGDSGTSSHDSSHGWSHDGSHTCDSSHSHDSGGSGCDHGSHP